MNVTLSICNQNNLICICIFNGQKYIILNPFYDNFLMLKSREIINQVKPSKIISSLSGIFISSFNDVATEKIQIKQRSVSFRSISKIENLSIRLLTTFLKHSPLNNVESQKIVGYAGEFLIEKEDKVDFYINNSMDLIKDFKRVNSIIKGTKTVYGKYKILEWISNPITTESLLNDRRRKANYIYARIPKIERLLKRANGNSFEKKNNLLKMKKQLKAVLLLQKFLREEYRLGSQKRFLKIYKMLHVVDEKGITSGKDAKIDQIRAILVKIPSILEKTAQEISTKYKIPASIVFIPSVGFLVESPVALSETNFRIKDQCYFKTKETANLDSLIGDPYLELAERESYIFAKILEKTQKCKFTEIYDFIGEVDAHISLCNNTEGVFSECLHENQPLLLNNLHLKPKSIFLTSYEIADLAEFIVINQIGGRIPIKKIPLFTQLALKLKSNSFSMHSTFQKEVIELAEIFRKCNTNAVCLIDRIGESTTPKEGLSLFISYVKSINPRYLIINTNLDPVDVKKKIAEHYFQSPNKEEGRENQNDDFDLSCKGNGNKAVDKKRCLRPIDMNIQRNQMKSIYENVNKEDTVKSRIKNSEIAIYEIIRGEYMQIKEYYDNEINKEENRSICNEFREYISKQKDQDSE